MLKYLYRARNGLLAQVLSMTSSFLPILFSRNEVLVYVIVVSAATSVLLQSTLLGAQVRVPLERSYVRSREILVYGLLATLLIATLLGSAGAIFWQVSQDEIAIALIGIALLLICQGAYLGAIALAVRDSAIPVLMTIRLIAASLTFVCTLLCVLLGLGAWAFIVSAAAGYVISGATGLIHLNSSRITATVSARLSMRRLGSSVRVAFPVMTTYTLSALSTQTASLVTAGLGPLAVAWATAVRVSSGFQTIGGQLLAPQFEAEIASQVRGGRSSRTATRNTFVAGSVLTGLFFAGVVAALAWTDLEHVLLSPGFVVAGIGLLGGSVFLAPSDRILVLLGKARRRLLWDSLRLSGFTCLIVFSSGSFLLIGLGIVGAVSTIAYAVLCWRASRKTAID